MFGLLYLSLFDLSTCKTTYDTTMSSFQFIYINSQMIAYDKLLAYMKIVWFSFVVEIVHA